MHDEYEAYGHTGPVRAGASGEPRSALLWQDLARAAYAIDDRTRPVPPVDGRMLAQVISAHAPERAYYASLQQPLASLAAELKHEAAEPRETAQRRLSELTAELGLDTLRSVLASSGETGTIREFLRDAVDCFPIDVLLRLLLAAAPEAGQELSRPFVRLLYKLAVQSRVGPPDLQAGADAALREMVSELIGRWWMVQTGAMAFGMDELFQAPQQKGGGPSTPDPDRMVLMALEVDTVGVPIWGPVTRMLADGRFGELLTLMRQAPRDSRAAQAIAQHIATPQRLSLLLGEPEVDFELVDRLVEHMGMQAAPVLLDRLATAESRTTRRGIFDRLVGFGPAIGPAAFDRLDDPRWFVQRNVLALLAELEWWPEEASPDDYIQHDDPRVRKEAIRTLLRVPRHRERALISALRTDTDRQTLRMVLAAAQEDCPASLVPIIVKRLDDGGLPPDLKAAAVRLLGGSRSKLALETLLRIVTSGSTLLGRPKLAPKSSECLAGLRALALAWRSEPRARAVLERAARSKDADIAMAVQETEREA